MKQKIHRYDEGDMKHRTYNRSGEPNNYAAWGKNNKIQKGTYEPQHIQQVNDIRQLCYDIAYYSIVYYTILY